MRVGQGYITSSNKIVQISSNTSALQEVTFLSILNESDEAAVVLIRVSTTDTSTFADGYKYLYNLRLLPQETRIFTADHFPVGATGSTHFGGSGSTDKLEIYTDEEFPGMFVFYSVYDLSNPRSLTGIETNFVGDSGSGGEQGLVPPPSAGDAAAGKYLDSDGTWTTPPDTNTTPNATNVEAAGALMDSEVTNLAQVKAFDSSDYATSAQGTKADTAHGWGNHGSAGYSTATGVENNADVTDTANVESSGALMDSELTDLAGVKGVTISTLQVKPSEGAFANGDKTKLDGIAAGAEVNVQSDWNSSSGDNQILNKPTIPAAYVDADAVSAVSTADDYLKNDVSDTMAGALTLEDALFLVRDDGTNTTKSKLQNNATSSNRTITVPDASGVMALTSDLPPSAVSTGVIKWLQAKVVLTEAQLNSMHSTPIQLVAHAGTDTIIMVGEALALVDRDGSTAQGAAVDLCIGYDGTTVYSESILYERRFMYNVPGDRTWSLKADYSGEVGGSLTAAVDKDVTVAFTGAITSGSLDSVTLYIQYYIIDNS
tara:strand:+ start:29385 stop:31016 length:1632 start_codon:yes stop_codon:yes gene_type:complete